MFPNFAPRNATAPKPIAVAAPVLKIDKLKAAYDWMPIDKMASLKLAHEWYADAIEPTDGTPSPLLYMNPLTVDNQKLYDQAVKVRNLANGTPYPEEQMSSYSRSLKQFEKIWGAKFSLPTLDAAAAATDLSPRVANIQTVLNNYNAAFKSFNVKFRITFGADRHFSEGEILLPEAEVSRLVGEPPLKAILGEALTVAKVASIVSDGNGGQKLDGALYMANLPRVLTAVYDWAAGADRLLKPVGKVAKVKASKGTGTRAPRVPRTPGTPSVKVGANQTINIVRSVSGLASGKRKQAMLLMVQGMTVAEYRRIVAATPGLDTGYATSALKAAVDAGAVTLV